MEIELKSWVIACQEPCCYAVIEATNQPTISVTSHFQTNLRCLSLHMMWRMGICICINHHLESDEITEHLLVNHFSQKRQFQRWKHTCIYKFSTFILCCDEFFLIFINIAVTDTHIMVDGGLGSYHCLGHGDTQPGTHATFSAHKHVWWKTSHAWFGQNPWTGWMVCNIYAHNSDSDRFLMVCQYF